MAFRFLPLALLGVFHVVRSTPIAPLTLQDLELSDDTVSVGSYVREVRAAPPEDYDRSYENEGDGEIGYSRKKSGGGKKGYQHFDAYHKKAGDNYEFEKSDSYGKDDEDHKGAYSHRHEQKAKYQRPIEPESEDIDEGSYYEHSKSKKNSKKNKKKHDIPHSEHDHEELREGAPDGNGGIEAFGHDPNDYVLPEKYIRYGEEEEEEEEDH